MRTQSCCPFCNLPAHPVAVHGHVQCSRCGKNLEPCCGGEQACAAAEADQDGRHGHRPIQSRA